MSYMWTVEKHERIVASQDPRGKVQSCAKLVTCYTCGALFRTTDWPPVSCSECRQEITDGKDI